MWKRTVLRAGSLLVVAGAIVAAVPATASLMGPKGDSPEAKRKAVREQSAEMLAQLYREKPELEARLEAAPGYATFNTTNVNLFLLASGNGYGVLKDNRSGKETFMRVASLGAGVGAGVKDFRAIFVFHDADVMRRFVEDGWQFGVQADAAAKAGDKGAAAAEGGAVDRSGSGGVSSGAGEVIGTSTPIEIYQFTETGIALQAVAAGTKYWKDSKLNA
jgi:lipid-binding SYLF domain-containing protein